MVLKMRRKQQLDFFLHKNLNPSFGGSQLKSHPKGARPVSTKHLMHIVLKSENAHGKLSFLRKERELLTLARGLGTNLNVRIKDIVVMSNHLHLLLQVRSRRALQNYLRAFAGMLARRILGAQRFRPAALRSFFSGRPFSRIVAAGRRSWIAIREYFELNRLEKLGFSKTEGRRLTASRDWCQ